MKNEAGGGGSLQGNELKLDDQCLSSLPGWVVETQPLPETLLELDVSPSSRPSLRRSSAMGRYQRHTLR